MKFSNILLGILIGACLSACGGGSGGSPQSTIDGMYISTSPSVNIGQSSGGSVCIASSTAIFTVNITSSNNNTATVNPSTCSLQGPNCCGFSITGLQTGPVTITATASGYTPASATMAVVE